MRIAISAEADVSRSLLRASGFAEEVGFERSQSQEIATVVSELARNIIKYAVNGEILLERIEHGSRSGVQVVARDRGPGIASVDEALRDHYSTSGTLGLGLPGVRRLVDEFEIDSVLGRGTTVRVRKWLGESGRSIRSILMGAARGAKLDRGGGADDIRGEAPDSARSSSQEVDCAYYIRPCRGERVSGDLVVIERRGRWWFLALIDALGHGPAAHSISLRACEHLKKAWSEDVVRTTQELHRALRGTDGAAAGICVVESGSREVRYVGIGNTVIRSTGTEVAGAFSTPGTLGHQIRTPREQRFRLGERQALLLYSDGVKERFDLGEYPRLLNDEAATIARTIVTRFGKSHDDASCAVLRYGR